MMYGRVSMPASMYTTGSLRVNVNKIRVHHCAIGRQGSRSSWYCTAAEASANVGYCFAEL